MGRQSERRALYYESDESYDPTLSVDINEYLIENYPVLNLRQRTSVWTLCQNDEEFDYSAIHEQIDVKVYEYAEADDSLNIDDLFSDEDDEEEEYEDEEYEEDDEEYDDEEYEDGEEIDTSMLFIVDAQEYYNEVWPELDDEQIAGVIEFMNDDEAIDLTPVYNILDEYVAKYANEVDDSIDTSVAEVESDISIDTSITEVESNISIDISLTEDESTDVNSDDKPDPDPEPEPKTTE